MHANNLLDIDPEKIFIEYSIKDIQDLDNKIQLEIEKKRHELRCMVGERYRDVLTTADTIQHMQHSAETFRTHIHNINQKCYSIQSNIKEEKPTVQPVNSSQIFFRSVAIQIKILILIPEIIWTCLDKCDYLKAVQIYLFAIHIQTGLELNKEHKVLEKFPILSRLKLSINLFRNRILEGINRTLQEVKLEPQDTSCHLCAYILLENKTQEEALKHFIDLRHKSLLSLVDIEVTLHNAVRLRILNLIQCLVCTINLLNSCFLNGIDKENNHSLKIYLENTLNKNGESILNMLELEKSALLEYIPLIVREYKPSCKESTVELSQEAFKKVLNNWLDLTSDMLNTRLSKSLEHITSVKILYNIREEIIKLELDNWKQECLESFLPMNFNVWQYFIQPLISKRAEDLVKHRIKSNLKMIFDKITNYFYSCKQTDDKLQKFVWTEASDSSSKDFNSHERLTMQTKGFSPKIVDLCKTFDNIYFELLQEVSLYLYGTANFVEMKEQNDEGKKLEYYLREEGSNSIDQLITYVEKEIQKSGNKFELTGARLFQAISQLCPNLQKCCSVANTPDGWEKVLQKLNSHCLRLWDHWLHDFKKHIEYLSNEYFSLDITYCNMLNIFPKWEVMEIEEQTDDRVIKSQIKLPTHPSVPLVTLLSAVLSDLDKVVPHTIPKTVHNQFIDTLITIIFSHYEKLSVNKDVNQNLAIQLLLDVKFLTMVCVRRECKMLTTKSQEICENLRSKVDPFDLNVFYSYLQSCIKQSVIQMNVLFGCLLGSTNQLSNIGIQEPINLPITDQEPTIFPYNPSYNDVWFPLLPVTMPITKSLISNLSTHPNVTPTSGDVRAQPRRSSPTSGGNFVRSGAAALLADWFS